MPTVRVNAFAGEMPISGDRALPEGFATESFNTYLYGKELRGVRPAAEVIAIQVATRKVFRVPKRTVGGDPANPTEVPPPSYMGDSIWMQFTDPDTDIVRGQLLEDSFERWYFCSPSTGILFNTYARMVAGLAPYNLGVPGPDITIDSAGNNPDKPTIVITGGAAPTTTRAYLYTWVNEFGEESHPSLPSLAAGNADDGSDRFRFHGICDPGHPARHRLVARARARRGLPGRLRRLTLAPWRLVVYWTL